MGSIISQTLLFIITVPTWVFFFQFLPVYKPNQQEIENPRLFAENVRAVMAE